MVSGGARFRRGALAACAIAVVVIVTAVIVCWPGSESASPATVVAQQFPDIDRAVLSAGRSRVLDVLEVQFKQQSAGEMFSEGAAEPWCADFVSWVMHRAGLSLRNPNSGSWRIPGVYTMQEYYASVHRLAPASSTPRPGDVMLWGPDSPMGLHVNIVIAAVGATVTTVGGNEGGIRIRRTEVAADLHLLGYGRLD
jgi:CHAP domain